MQLTAPSGTVSPLTRKRIIDNITGYRNLTDWIITTLFHWGEDPTGSWELNIDDFDKNIPCKGRCGAFILHLDVLVDDTMNTILPCSIVCLALWEPFYVKNRDSELFM